MSEFSGFNIKKIHIIVYKEEKGKFDFENRYRTWDGFVLITSGTGYALDKNGRKYELETGHMLLLREGDSYETHFDGDCSYITSAFDFGFDSGGDFPIDIPFVVKCSQKQVQKIMSICEIWQSRSWDAYTKCRIMLLEFYLDVIKRQMESDVMDKDISKAISFIHQNFKSNFQGEDLAKYCSLSPSYLRSKFLRETGSTITAYRENLRIMAAKEMLDSGIYSMTEIAVELGYCDIYHFSKAFKKHFGTSPTNYSKIYKNKQH